MTHAEGHINTEDIYNMTNWSDAVSFWMWFYSQPESEQDITKVTTSDTTAAGVGDTNISGAGNVEYESIEDRQARARREAKAKAKDAENSITIGNYRVPSTTAALAIFQEYTNNSKNASTMGIMAVDWTNTDADRKEWSAWNSLFQQDREAILLALDEGNMGNQGFILPDGMTYSASTRPSIADILAAYTAFSTLMSPSGDQANEYQTSWEARNDTTFGETFGVNSNNQPPFGILTPPTGGGGGGGGGGNVPINGSGGGDQGPQETGTLRVWYMEQGQYVVEAAHIDIPVTDDEMSALATYFASTGNKFGKYEKAKNRAQLHVDSFWDMRAAINRQWDIDASAWMVMGEAEKDIGDELRVSLLQKLESVMKYKPVNPRTSGMPQFNGDSLVEQQMRENGIYYALDPVMGIDASGNTTLRWELLDATPWEGTPVGAYEWIAYDPQTDPFGPGYWRVNENKVLQLEKTVYEGVPQNVRGPLQIVLDAGGDIDVLPDGHTGKAWVIYLLQQARMASGEGAMPQGVVFNPGEPAQLDLDRALPRLAPSILQYTGRISTDSPMGIGARVDRGMGFGMNPDETVFEETSGGETQVISQQKIPNPFGEDHTLIEFDDGGSLIMDSTGKVLRYTPAPTISGADPDAEVSTSNVPSSYFAAMDGNMIGGTRRQISAGKAPVGSADPTTKPIDVSQATEDDPATEAVEGPRANELIGMSGYHGNMDNVENETTVGNRITRTYKDGSVVVIIDGEAKFFYPGTGQNTTPFEYTHQEGEQGTFDINTGTWSGGYGGRMYTNTTKLGDHIKLEGNSPQVQAYNAYLDYLNSQRRRTGALLGSWLDPKAGNDRTVDDQGFLYGLHKSIQHTAKGNIDDRENLYLENLKNLATINASNVTTSGGGNNTGNTSTSGSNITGNGSNITGNGGNGGNGGSDTSYSGVGDPGYTAGSGMSIRGDKRTEVSSIASAAGANTWSDYLTNIEGLSDDYVPSGVEAAKYWENYLRYTAAKNPTGITN